MIPDKRRLPNPSAPFLHLSSFGIVFARYTSLQSFFSGTGCQFPSALGAIRHLLTLITHFTTQDPLSYCHDDCAAGINFHDLSHDHTSTGIYQWHTCSSISLQCRGGRNAKDIWVSQQQHHTNLADELLDRF
jgi:hypothetical protein